MSRSFGDTDTAAAGNVAPYNWPWTASGAPDAYFGDRTDQRQSGANSAYTTYDQIFSSGGGMHSSVNDYMTASISQSGTNYNIDITYKYTGAGNAAGNMKLYALSSTKTAQVIPTRQEFRTATTVGWLG